MPEPTPVDPEVKVVETPAVPGTQEAQARAIAAISKDKPPAPPEAAPAEATSAPPTGESSAPGGTDDPRLARLYGQTARMEQALRQQQQENKKLSARVAQLDEAEKEWADDPYAAAQRRGLDAKEWVSRELGMESLLPEEDAGEQALEEIKAMREREQARTDQETQLQAQTRFAEIRGHVGKFLEDNKFTAVRSSPAAVERLATQVRQMEVGGEFAGMTPDQINQTLTTMTTQTDEALRNEVSTYLQADGVLTALLKDESIAKVIREALGTPQPSAGTPPPAGNGAGNEPRTITERLASEPGSREVAGTGSTPLSAFDRERAAVVALERAFARQKAG